MELCNAPIVRYIKTLMLFIKVFRMDYVADKALLNGYEITVGLNYFF